ncbi:MAG: hypothetical protein A2W68_04215 [Betaproteobacteria bacterium RIFCSPLOWO2_02_64_14]|nr:MAG: hypothetical protein A2W68_04215 [Betaproteobacteria bacterium RIFCSPLOWO2_02_64_14]
MSRPMGLLVAGFNYAAVNAGEFNDWYETEHLPQLSQVSGCLAARRFRVTSGAQRYLALYHLTGPEVVASKAWEAVAATPWTLRLRPHICDRLRLVLRRYRRDAA